MAQHDQVIDNGSGLAVRTDFNSAIAALFSNSSGPVEPAVTVAGQFWWDTANASNPVLRQRNLANTGWMTVFQGGQSAIDIATGKRAGPPNDTFVWNDKLDLSGTDVMTLDDTGNLMLKNRLMLDGTEMSLRGATATSWFWNSKADGSGTDILKLDNTGKMTFIAPPDLKVGFLDAFGDILKFNTTAVPNITAAIGAAAAQILWSGHSEKHLFANPGYQKFPNGLIIQFGQSVSGVADYTLAFPTAFPSSCLGVAQLASVAGVGGTSFYVAQTSNVSPTTMDIRTRSQSGASTSGAPNCPVMWIAVGY